MLTTILILVFCGTVAVARPEKRLGVDDAEEFHPYFGSTNIPEGLFATGRNEETATFWNIDAQRSLLKKINNQPIKNVAKNVILFLGDGMSIPTLTAARVYYGGEEKELSFEKLPYTALAKTYCVNAQTADSACTATAYLTGIKNNYGMLGVTAAVPRKDCEAMMLKENQVESIAKWSQEAGKRTGIVTTSTVMDASPAGAFAKIADRGWQTDISVQEAGCNDTNLHDITYQLVKTLPGKEFNVILGGGAEKFLTLDTTDELGNQGQRTDMNLIDEWVKDRSAEGKKAEYVWNKSGLLGLKTETDYVLGLFSGGFMPYNLDRDQSLTPSLEEMTEVAIKIASKGNGAENGYFLFIEGGRIDHGHHSTYAKQAFEETIEFSKAIQKALDLTSEQDTLIVVTADHAHTMSMSGYPDRGNNIFGVAGNDGYGDARLTINYANGPAPVNNSQNYGNDDTDDKTYQFPAVSYLKMETHGADDVGIFARGPYAHLFTGVMEQHLIPHIMAYASCVGKGIKACVGKMEKVESSSFRTVDGGKYFLILLLLLSVIVMENCVG